MLGKVSLLPGSGDGTPLESNIVAASWRELPSADILLTREQVALAYPNLSVATIKQVDEQALVALLAIADAIATTGQTMSFYQNWGLISAGRSLGRKRIAESLLRFRQQGAWSVSPHVIPNCSLHSLSGILSQALRLHGPNIGSGGVSGAEAEAFWAAMGWLHGEKLPGVWMVLTAWDRESTTVENTFCRAVVIGLTCDGSEGGFPRVCESPQGQSSRLSAFRFEELWDVIREPRPARWVISGAECLWHPQAHRQTEAA